MSTEIQKSDYELMDDLDSQQIVNGDAAIKQDLAYVTPQGKKQLSYMGIKWLVLRMSQKGQPLQFPEMPEVHLEKYDEADQTTWIWYATVKCRNVSSGLDTIGTSEQPFLARSGDSTYYDSFGRTKAISKAERNAYRKQIPELMINEMLNQASGAPVRPATRKAAAATTQGASPPPNDEKDMLASQEQTLRELGWRDEIPPTYKERHDLIVRVSANSRKGA